MLTIYKVKIPEAIIEVETHGTAEDAKKILREQLRDAGHTDTLDSFFPPALFEVVDETVIEPLGCIDVYCSTIYGSTNQPCDYDEVELEESREVYSLAEAMSYLRDKGLASVGNDTFASLDASIDVMSGDEMTYTALLDGFSEENAALLQKALSWDGGYTNFRSILDLLGEED